MITKKDEEILKKYDEMPNLRVKELDDDTKYSLLWAGVLFAILFGGISLMLIAGGYESLELKEYKQGIMENIKKMDENDCEKLFLMDLLLSKYESLQDETRRSVNDRIIELNCME